MMKLLIAYDGSASANDALDDLLRAGLPEKAKAIVFSVAELWFPPPTDHLEPRPRMAKAEGLPVHVDAAWAGSAMICPEFRHFWDGV